MKEQERINLVMQPDEQIAQIIKHHARNLANAALAQRLAYRPDWNLGGDEAVTTQYIKQIETHLKYLAQAAANAQVSLFKDYIHWIQALFTYKRLPDEYLASTLGDINHALAFGLPSDTYGVAAIYLKAGEEQLLDDVGILADQMPSTKPVNAFPAQYMSLLLSGKRNLTSSLITDTVLLGMSIQEIYLNILQPAQSEMAQLWQTNHINMGQKHYCMAATHLIMTQLFPYIHASKRNGRVIIAICGTGEFYELGMRMLCDLFEIEGWDSYYLGATSEDEPIINLVEVKKADILAISATLSIQIDAIAHLIKGLRSTPAGQKVKIIVEGPPFKNNPDLWQWIGADNCADNTQSVYNLANILTGLAG